MPDETAPSTADLIRRLSDESTTLIRQELRLAQLELQEKGKRAGIGAGLFGAASGLALFALGALVAAAILGLSTTLDAWLAALIVGGALLSGAGVLALVGKTQVSRAVPPAPEKTIESTRADVTALKEAAHR
jgi:uncharacterized membrane protein YqjE